jgi:hypothetical protein
MGRSSRASSVGVALALTIVTLVSVKLSGHRRDEYLQAARLAIEPGRVQIELDLTPGIAVADAVMVEIDRDRDGQLSANERRDYAALAVRALQVELDGMRLPVQLDVSRFPDVEAIRRGEGIIRVESSAPIQPLTAGSHQLLFRNRHHPENSVYLANALVPESDRVAVRAQRRDAEQRELTIEYSLGPAPFRATRAWLLGSLAVGVLLLGLMRRSSRPFIAKSDRSASSI